MVVPDPVSDIQQALGVTAADLTELKSVRLVWKKLEDLRRKAEKGQPKDLAAYRDLLQKHLAAARQNVEITDPAAASQAFWSWYLEQCAVLGVGGLETSRGSTHQDWCAKWKAIEYKAFESAVARMIDRPTEANFQEARDAANKMLRAYVEAFKEN